jgi:hypothetical protein
MTDIAAITGIIEHLEYLLRNGATYVFARDLGADVLDAIEGFVSRFIAFPNEHVRHAYVLWCAHAWLMDCWGTTPRLLFASPEAGSGKTVALEILEWLVPHPHMTSNTSPAYFQHLIEESRELNGVLPTLFLDEIDTVFVGRKSRTQNAEDLRNIIDAGYRRGGKVTRRIGKNNEVFRVFSPMALAGKMLPADVPDTIRSRSIVVPMQWRHRRTNSNTGTRKTRRKMNCAPCAACCSGGPNLFTATPRNTPAWRYRRAPTVTRSATVTATSGSRC